MHQIALDEMDVAVENTRFPTSLLRRRIIDEGVETGGFRTHMPSEVVAETIFHMIGGLAPAIARGSDPDLTAERVTTMLLEGLRC